MNKQQVLERKEIHREQKNRTIGTTGATNNEDKYGDWRSWGRWDTFLKTKDGYWRSGDWGNCWWGNADPFALKPKEKLINIKNPNKKKIRKPNIVNEKM